jgi:hypothetical protein
MGREGGIRAASDIRAQSAGMILGLSSQNFIRLKKLNDSRRLWVSFAPFE